jgi:hypothetical protein
MNNNVIYLVNEDDIDIRDLYAQRLLFGPELDEDMLKQADQLLGDHQASSIQLCYDILDMYELQEDDAPANAVKLLHHWRVRDAVPRIVHVIEEDLKDLDTQSYACVAAIDALCHWGPEVVDALFDLVDTVDQSYRVSLAAYMAINGRGHSYPHVYAWVKARFLVEDDVCFWSESLLRMGGEDAVALIEADILNKDECSHEVKERLRKYIQDFRAGRQE